MLCITGVKIRDAQFIINEAVDSFYRLVLGAGLLRVIN